MTIGSAPRKASSAKMAARHRIKQYHRQIWQGLDNLAQRQGMALPQLARKAGLRPESLTLDQRQSKNGRLRWPNFPILLGLLHATGENFAALDLAGDSPAAEAVGAKSGAMLLPPLIMAAEAPEQALYRGGYLRDNPTGRTVAYTEMPQAFGRDVFAIQLDGTVDFAPYRTGDKIIIAPGLTVRPGDLVVALDADYGLAMGHIFRKSLQQVEIAFLAGDAIRIYPTRKLVWLSRVACILPRGR